MNEVTRCMLIILLRVSLYLRVGAGEITCNFQSNIITKEVGNRICQHLMEIQRDVEKECGCSGPADTIEGTDLSNQCPDVVNIVWNPTMASTGGPSSSSNSPMEFTRSGYITPSTTDVVHEVSTGEVLKTPSIPCTDKSSAVDGTVTPTTPSNTMSTSHPTPVQSDQELTIADSTSLEGTTILHTESDWSTFGVPYTVASGTERSTDAYITVNGFSTPTTSHTISTSHFRPTTVKTNEESATADSTGFEVTPALFTAGVLTTSSTPSSAESGTEHGTDGSIGVDSSPATPVTISTSNVDTVETDKESTIANDISENETTELSTENVLTTPSTPYTAESGTEHIIGASITVDDSTSAHGAATTISTAAATSSKPHIPVVLIDENVPTSESTQATSTSVEQPTEFSSKIDLDTSGTTETAAVSTDKGRLTSITADDSTLVHETTLASSSSPHITNSHGDANGKSTEGISSSMESTSDVTTEAVVSDFSNAYTATPGDWQMSDSDLNISWPDSLPVTSANNGTPDTSASRQVSTNPIRYQGNVSDSCMLNTSLGACFWTSLIARGETNLERANETCSSHNSVLAVIYDQAKYEEIEANVRTKLSSSWSSAALWLGMTFDPATGTMYPVGAFDGKWHPEHPKSNNLAIHILMLVQLNYEVNANSGLRNAQSTAQWGGVVCWKP